MNKILNEDVSRSNHQKKKRTKKRSRIYDDELDEVLDGDEGIVNRRLPINSYNH